MSTQQSLCGFGTFSRTKNFLTAIAAAMLFCAYAHADGCFVFVWNKAKDINEPTQKAILLHDAGREDLVLQVKYEGPAEDFGWLVPVPSLPEVRKGSMNCFYELSRLTQERFGDGYATMGLARHNGESEPVKVIEIKTVGAYEVAVLSASDAAGLQEWLDAHHFVFPKEKQDVLENYVTKQWYFVAIKVNPERNGFAMKSGPPKKAAVAPTIRKQLAKGELHPLVLSFAAEKCVFPLAISSVNGKPSEISLYVLSAEPLASTIIVDREFESYRQRRAQWLAGKKEREERQERQEEMISRTRVPPPEGSAFALLQARREDPADPEPDPVKMRQIVRGTPSPYRWEDDYYSHRDQVRSAEVQASALPACSRELPRLAGKSWWLTKQVRVFAPEEMRDLVFEPVIPMLAANLRSPDGLGSAYPLGQYGTRAVPVLLAALRSSDPIERRHALSALADFRRVSRPRASASPQSEPGKSSADSTITAALVEALGDTDARTRAQACDAASMNWNKAFVPKLTNLLEDEEPRVRTAACSALREHPDDLADQQQIYKRMVKKDGAAAPYAITLVMPNPFTRNELLGMLASTNVPVISTSFSQLRGHCKARELAPLLTNSVPLARLMGLGELTRIGDKAAVDLIVSMLHDPEDTLRWRVRSSLRQLSGQKLGADPATWEQWWTKAKDTYAPPPLPQPR